MREREQTYRTFIAIELPINLRKNITQHIERLRREFPNFRASWGREDNLHLTLKFLGNVPVGQMAALSEAAEKAARTTSAFDLIVDGSGSFPISSRPKVLWIGIEDASGKLHALQTELENQCAIAGFAPETRAYSPHLTIGRLRQSDGAWALAEYHARISFPSRLVTVNELIVFRSELLREGSKHTPISRHRLG